MFQIPQPCEGHITYLRGALFPQRKRVCSFLFCSSDSISDIRFPHRSGALFSVSSSMSQDPGASLLPQRSGEARAMRDGFKSSLSLVWPEVMVLSQYDPEWRFKGKKVGYLAGLITKIVIRIWTFAYGRLIPVEKTSFQKNADRVSTHLPNSSTDYSSMMFHHLPICLTISVFSTMFVY